MSINVHTNATMRPSILNSAAWVNLCLAAVASALVLFFAAVFLHTASLHG